MRKYFSFYTILLNCLQNYYFKNEFSSSSKIFIKTTFLLEKINKNIIYSYL